MTLKVDASARPPRRGRLKSLVVPCFSSASFDRRHYLYVHAASLLAGCLRELEPGVLFIERFTTKSEAIKSSPPLPHSLPGTGTSYDSLSAFLTPSPKFSNHAVVFFLPILHRLTTHHYRCLCPISTPLEVISHLFTRCSPQSLSKTPQKQAGADFAWGAGQATAQRRCVCLEDLGGSGGYKTHAYIGAGAVRRVSFTGAIKAGVIHLLGLDQLRNERGCNGGGDAAATSWGCGCGCSRGS